MNYDLEPSILFSCKVKIKKKRSGLSTSQLAHQVEAYL